MTQEPYGDPASLLRSVLADLARAAYGLLGHHADTEDAVQNGCVKLITAWPRVAGLATPGEQRAYLIRIVLNEALQILRDPHHRWEHPGVDVGERAVTQHPFEDEIQAKEDLRLVWKAIGDMPDMRRDAVLLRAAGYEYRDIATRLGIKVSTVRSHISDARKQLSRTLPRGLGGGVDEHRE
jgi:RNA polymerase sigma factor (sigma-70 family)